MIVVDTNIIVYLYLAGDHSAQAERAFLKDPLWAAPLLWRSEFRNVLAFYIRKQHLSITEAWQIMEEALGLMQGREYEMASHQILDLIPVSTCTAYDCEFVALAKELDLPLVTIDNQILNQFPNDAISLENFITE